MQMRDDFEIETDTHDVLTNDEHPGSADERHRHAWQQGA
jgi:hypothetical protein